MIEEGRNKHQTMQFSLKYRPKFFKDVVGQAVSIRILQNTLLMNRVPTAILISGHHGSGKTTIARIYARYLNCENAVDKEPCGVCSSCREPEHLSILELDAASNNSVDDARELESLCAQVNPYRWRVILLDECHMLTKQAQAALLKLFEEPPDRTVFILLTTDAQKLEDTVRSRCLSLPLRLPTESEIFDNLVSICNEEELYYFPDALKMISRSGASIRDCQQILNGLSVLSAGGEITMGLLDSSGQLISSGQYRELAPVLVCKDLQYGLQEVQRWYAAGVDLQQLFAVGLPILLRDILVFTTESGNEYMSGIPHDVFVDRCHLTLSDVELYLREWEVSIETMRTTSFPQIIWGLYLTKIFVDARSPRKDEFAVPEMLQAGS